jgi:hypothetical protein
MQIKKQLRTVSAANLKYRKPVTDPRPAVVFMEDVKRILAFIPEAGRCTVAVVELYLRFQFIQKTAEFGYDSHAYTVIHSGKLQHPITDLTQLHQQSIDFWFEVRALCDEHKVDAIAVQRSPHLETVSATVGILSRLPAVYYTLPTRFTEWTNELKQKPMKMWAIMPSTWKPSFSKFIDLNALYAHVVSQFNVTAREVDAACLAVYVLRRAAKARYKFDNLMWNPFHTLHAYTTNR